MCRYTYACTQKVCKLKTRCVCQKQVLHTVAGKQFEGIIDTTGKKSNQKCCKIALYLQQMFCVQTHTVVKDYRHSMWLIMWPERQIVCYKWGSDCRIPQTSRCAPDDINRTRTRFIIVITLWLKTLYYWVRTSLQAVWVKFSLTAFAVNVLF